MKALAISKVKIVAGIVAFNFVMAVIAYFAITPFFSSHEPGENLAISAILFLFGVVSGLATMQAVASFYNPERRLLEVCDAVKQPILILGEDNRYALLNREAETVLGLNREKDRGKPADSRITSALAAGASSSPDALNIQTIFEQNGEHYQVFDNPLPFGGAGTERARVVALREVSHILRLREALREISRTMVVLNANAAKISNSAVSLSQGATEQASSLASITATMDDFSKKIQGSTETAAQGTQLAAQARDAAEHSGTEIAHALAAMNDVQDAGVRIARIVKLIDDIAFQTNLLALNAAVEAARAGRQGKGFAVVAEEVRNLAGRSARAAKDTAGMVEDVTERIGNASLYISKLEEMLRNITQDAIRIADSSAVASTTSAEQTSGILRVNQELAQINSVTNSTMSAAEQTATAVEVLSKQVQTLKAKLDGLSDSFDLDENASSDRPIRGTHNLSINLVDDPETFGAFADKRPRSYLTDSDFPIDSFPGLSANADDEDSAEYKNPFRDISNENLDWDLNAETEDDETSPLANLLRDDGYEQRYRDFLESSTKSLSSYVTGSGEAKKSVPDIETPDGDRVVKPNQNIQLDDSEFGRY